MNTIKNMAEVEVAAKKEFAASKELQAEFGGQVDDYLAFKKAEAALR